MTQELKPCPLCGGKPYLANVAMLGCAYVVCTDCRLQTDDGSAERVVAHWNTRADLPPTLAEALALPEVRALVEAAENALSNLRMGKSGAQILQARLVLERALAAQRGGNG